MKQQFLNEDDLFEDIKMLLSDRNDSEYIDEDFISDYAFEVCRGIMRDMDKYVHMRDKSISGNLMQIDLNWEWDHKDDSRSFDEIVKLMDSGKISEEELQEIQQWTKCWFFEAFGTFGITYEFDCVCSEIEYEREREEEDAA